MSKFLEKVSFFVKISRKKSILCQNFKKKINFMSKFLEKCLFLSKFLEKMTFFVKISRKEILLMITRAIFSAISSFFVNIFQISGQNIKKKVNLMSNFLEKSQFNVKISRKKSIMFFYSDHNFRLTIQIDGKDVCLCEWREGGVGGAWKWSIRSLTVALLTP